MSYDLRTGLHALSTDERAAAPELPVGDLRGRARRRRTVRMALTTTTALAAAGGIAVAAFALPGVDGAQQPAGTASPTWAPDAAGWPPSVTLDGPVPACGDTLPDLVQPSGEPALRVVALTQGGTLVGGVPTIVASTLTAPAGFSFRSAAPTLLVVRDGVVVGTETERGSQGDVEYGTAQGSVRFPVQELDLVRCETKGRGAVALEPGTYELYAVAEVLLGEPGDEGGSEERRTVVGGPFTLSIAADDGAAGWRDVDPSALPDGVPLLSEIILRSQVSADGSTWRVIAQPLRIDEDVYPLALAALQDAGFTVDREQTDPARPTWSHAELTSDAFHVTLDVSDSSNWGYYGEYVITARP